MSGFRKNGGFTLIEMLVAMGILSILATIAISYYGRLLYEVSVGKQRAEASHSYHAHVLFQCLAHEVSGRRRSCGSS